jgi:hypothetical protein
MEAIMKECIRITGAEYLDGYRISLRFNNDECGVVDLQDLVFRYPVAAPLRDKARFADFHLDSWPTLSWDCGFDVDPESLYERATAMAREQMQSA